MNEDPAYFVPRLIDIYLNVFFITQHIELTFVPPFLGYFGGPGGPSPLSMSSEKIYPADQPMVFNPQNPNAPPIYPCGICHKEVHDNDQVGNESKSSAPFSICRQVFSFGDVFS